MSWSRLIRFIPSSATSSRRALIGEPLDAALDVGLASLAEPSSIKVAVFSGQSVLEPGQRTEQVETVQKILSPLAQTEVGAIRCIGINVSALRALHDVDAEPPAVTPLVP